MLPSILEANNNTGIIQCTTELSECVSIPPSERHDLDRPSHSRSHDFVASASAYERSHGSTMVAAIQRVVLIPKGFEWVARWVVVITAIDTDSVDVVHVSIIIFIAVARWVKQVHPHIEFQVGVQVVHAGIQYGNDHRKCIASHCPGRNCTNITAGDACRTRVLIHDLPGILEPPLLREPRVIGLRGEFRDRAARRVHHARQAAHALDRLQLRADFHADRREARYKLLIKENSSPLRQHLGEVHQHARLDIARRIEPHDDLAGCIASFMLGERGGHAKVAQQDAQNERVESPDARCPCCACDPPVAHGLDLVCATSAGCASEISVKPNAPRT